MRDDLVGDVRSGELDEAAARGGDDRVAVARRVERVRFRAHGRLPHQHAHAHLALLGARNRYRYVG